MASALVGQTPASTSAAEVNNGPPKTPPLCSSTNVADTPPYTPTAVDPPIYAIEANAIKNISEELITEQLQTSGEELEGKGSFNSGEVSKHRQSTTSKVSVGNMEAKGTGTSEDHIPTQLHDMSAVNVCLSVTTTEEETSKEGRPSTAQTSSNTHDKTASGIKPCEVVSEQSAPAPALLATPREMPSTLKADSIDNKEDHISNKMGMQGGRGAGQDKIGRGTQDQSFGDDEDTAVDTAGQARSEPPHMRSTSKAANTHSTVGGRVNMTIFPSRHYTDMDQRDWPVPVPRAPRPHLPAIQYAVSRPPIDYDELRRTKAQVMKARDDLEAERKANAEMRKNVEAETQASVIAAMSDMLSDLLQKQANALMAKAKTQEKERELQYREQQITQIETYLSEGQKQLYNQLEQQGIQSMSAIEKTYLRHEAELKVKHQLSGIEDKIAIQVERLRHQEAAQTIREQQYKVLIHDALEAEVREQVSRDMQAKIADKETFQVAYERGTAEGKKEGSTEAPETASKDEFLNGYAVCYRSQTALHNMRNGRLTADSPELVFLHDPTHIENPYNIGLSVGRLAAAQLKSSSLGGIISRSSVAEGAALTATTTGKSQAISNAVECRERGSGQSIDACSLEQVCPAQQEESVQK